VIGLAVEGRTDVTGGPLQQLHAEPRFELFHGVRHCWARQAELLGREREAAPLHYPREHPHRVEPVQWFVRDSRIVMALGFGHPSWPGMEKDRKV